MDEWGPWTDHDGKGVPSDVRPGLVLQGVLLETRTGKTITGTGVITPKEMEPINWIWGQSSHDVLRYRIRKPRGLTILQEIAREVEKGWADA